MKIAKDSVVTMDYTLSDNKGSVIDSSEGNGAFAYLHGHDNIIPGLEKHLEGKESGFEAKVVVSPEEGYGEKDPRLVTTVKRTQFPASEQLSLGQRFQAASPEGDVQIFEITKIEGDEITIDGNHPLAGVELHFDVKVKDVRKASLEELSHGHVHGEGGHHH